LPWVEIREPSGRFEPVKVRAASMPYGTYEIFQDGVYFDAWFTKKADGVLVFIGRSENANTTREKCERHARRKRA
jgi:hypothetical protein